MAELYDAAMASGDEQQCFTGAGGLRLFVQHWPTDGVRSGHVVIVHGIGEHCGRYGNLVAALNAAGFDVHSFDHRGHGRSPGKRGHIEAWTDYRGDLDAFLRHLRERHATEPLACFGHSMGALIVLDYLIGKPDAADAAIVSGTPIQPKSVANPIKIAAARALSRMWPSCTLPLGIDPRLLSTDAAHVRASIADPLTHGRVTARWGTEILAAIDRVKQQAAGIRLPLLVLHGAEDRINDPCGSTWLFEHVGSADKQIVLYAGGRHEIQSDYCHRQVETDATAWLQDRLAQRTGRGRSATV